VSWNITHRVRRGTETLTLSRPVTADNVQDFFAEARREAGLRFAQHRASVPQWTDEAELREPFVQKLREVVKVTNQRLLESVNLHLSACAVLTAAQEAVEHAK